MQVGQNIRFNSPLREIQPKEKEDDKVSGRKRNSSNCRYSDRKKADGFLDCIGAVNPLDQ